MSPSNVIERILSDFEHTIKKPETYLSVSKERSEEIRNLTKQLYDLTKQKEEVGKYKDALPCLIIKGFDEEQIWQELELQSNAVDNSMVSNVAHLIACKDRIMLPSNTKQTNEGQDEDLDQDEDEEESNDDDHDATESHHSESEDSNTEDIKNSSKGMETKKPKRPRDSSIVDDAFFKLRDMEHFLEKVEREPEDKGGKNSDDEDIDLFGDDSVGSQDNEQAIRCRYSDFFDPPLETDGREGRRKKRDHDDVLEVEYDKKSGKKMKLSKSEKKKVTFDIDEEDEEQDDLDNEEDDLDDEEDGGQDDLDDEEEFGGDQDDLDEVEEEEEEHIKSSFESRQERLKSRIKSLEDEALQKKPWPLQGEVSATSRPQNSLLEEYVEFDVATRPAPIMTEQCTLRLEEVIKQRIKDKAWDDVERKVKPNEEVREYKKRLVLNQEKSKASLAEIYEQEFIKQRDGATADATGITEAEEKEEEPEAHKEIKKMMSSLMVKLDALCNFHYTPRQAVPEMKIVSNLPAIQMEEVAPVGVSDAMLLAPEEVKVRPKGDVKGKMERTDTDKKRERRQKKTRQRLRQKEKEKREKVVDKLNPGLGNKYSKEKAKKMLETLDKERNVSRIDEKVGKVARSSTKFFSQLQDEVSSQIKRQVGKDKPSKKKTAMFTPKKIKL